MFKFFKSKKLEEIETNKENVKEIELVETNPKSEIAGL